MKPFRGRIQELGTLRSLLDRTEPTLIQVHGPAGVGKTALLATALVDYDSHHHFVPPLPEPAQRAALARDLGLDPGSEPPDWGSLLDRFAKAHADSERARVIALDDAHRLGDARSRILEPLAAWLRAGSHEGGAPRHAVLSTRREGTIPDRALDGVDVRRLELHPLTLRAARPFLPGANAAELVSSYAVFGGLPSRLRLLDASSSIATNLRRLVLDADGSLASEGLVTLEREFQNPPRYAAVLASLAEGDSDWAAIHQGVPDVSTGGQIAPYLRKLQELGLIDVRQSLDARSGSRSRRYGITDDFVAFWFKFVLPAQGRIERGSGSEVLSEIRRDLDAHVAARFPRMCRQFMRHDARERLPANARECGGLWGQGYDIPVAGLLASGAAFYGMPSWPAAPTTRQLDELDARIRDTRYGFGREHRIRILFGPGPFPPELERRAARRLDTVLVDAGEMIGSEEET